MSFFISKEGVDERETGNQTQIQGLPRSDL